MGIGLDGSPPDLREQLPKTLPTLKSGADRQRIHKKTDQRLEARVAAAPQRNPDREILLMRVTVEQQRHHGEQAHVHGDGFGPAEIFERGEK